MQKSSFLIFFITGILFFTFSNASFAQSKKKKNKPKGIDSASAVMRQNVITTFPLSFVGGSILLGYERQYAHKKGIKFLAGVGAADRSRYYSANSDNFNGTYNYVDNMSSFYLEVQPRFYVIENKVPMNGLYMAPILNYKQMNFDLTIEDNFGPSPSTTTLEKQQASAYSIGYVIGYQAIFRSSLTLDFYAGGGMMRAQGDYKKINTQMGIDSYRNGITIHMGAALGIAF